MKSMQTDEVIDLRIVKANKTGKTKYVLLAKCCQNIISYKRITYKSGMVHLIPVTIKQNNEENEE